MTDLEYIVKINEILASTDKTLTDACKEAVIARSTISGKANRLGYKYSKSHRAFIYNSNTTVIEENTKDIHKSIDKSNTPVPKQQIKGIQENIIDVEYTEVLQQHTGVFSLEDMLKLKDILQYYNCIKEEYKEGKQPIKVELPENKETKNSNYKANKEVIELFNNFCEKHYMYKQQDLVSMALLEYIKRH